MKPQVKSKGYEAFNRKGEFFLQEQFRRRLWAIIPRLILVQSQRHE